MNITSDIKPVSYLKSHAAEILKQINEIEAKFVSTFNIYDDFHFPSKDNLGICFYQGKSIEINDDSSQIAAG